MFIVHVVTFFFLVRSHFLFEILSNSCGPVWFYLFKRANDKLEKSRELLHLWFFFPVSNFLQVVSESFESVGEHLS